MRRLSADLEEKQEPRVATLAVGLRNVEGSHDVTWRLDLGRDREAVVHEVGVPTSERPTDRTIDLAA
jgi:hypothetical protein